VIGNLRVVICKQKRVNTYRVQKLTTGAEANLLQFRLILDLATGDEQACWGEIKRAYARNQLLRGAVRPGALALACCFKVPCRQ
jgi:hypothetical protein